ncbi:MAG: DUF2269 family protein [Dehalococcoidia bacterium]
MNSYRVLLFLHIAVVIVGFGAIFVLPFLQAFAERTSVGATRFVLRFSRRLENFVIYPGSVLVFIFGIGLMMDDKTGYRDDMPVWLTIAIVWFLAIAALSYFVVRRTAAQALASLEGVADDGSFPAAYMALSKRLQMVGGIIGLSVVGIAFLMVWGADGGF